MFTHQGASWSPLMEYVENVPFPYDTARMPKTNSKLRGTWIENSLSQYKNESDPAFMRKTLDRVVTFANERDVPVFCGEFGVYDLKSPDADRVIWYHVVTDMLVKRNISRASWDYFGGFGIFNKSGGRDFKSDLNVNIVRAMGFTAPEQIPRNTSVLEEGFIIYDDYPAREYFTGGWGEGMIFNLYDTGSYQGEFCIRWGNADQYNSFWVSLSHNKNFSKLVNSGFAVEFYARTEEALSFDLRFLNPETSDLIPWRMRYTIDGNVLPPDGKWHKIRIPLAEMTEHGAWVNSQQMWLPPQGKFNWENVLRLEFVSEHHSLKNKYIWFDDIKITDGK
jgi:endoglucanase